MRLLEGTGTFPYLYAAGGAYIENDQLKGITAGESRGICDFAPARGGTLTWFLHFKTGVVSFPDNQDSRGNILTWWGWLEAAILNGQLCFYEYKTSTWQENLYTMQANTEYWLKLFKSESGEMVQVFVSTDGVNYTSVYIGETNTSTPRDQAPAIGNHSEASTYERPLIGAVFYLEDCYIKEGLNEEYLIWEALSTGNKHYYKSFEILRDYDVTSRGTATVDTYTNIASNFLGGYLMLNKNWSATPSSFQVKLHVKTPAVWGGLPNSNYAECIGLNSQDYTGLMINIQGTNSTPQWYIRVGTGSAWNNISAGGGSTVSLNTNYWFDISWNGTVWTAKISTDGVTYSTIGTLTSGWFANPGCYTLGNSPNSWSGLAPFSGTIYLDDCEIYRNNERVWKGSDTGSLQQFLINDSEIIFDSSLPGTYTVTLDAGQYEIVCVGAGGPAAMRGVYDDKGYGWGGGSGSAFKGVFTLAAGSYTVVVGSANNNTTAQSGNTQTLNPSDTTTHDSFIDGVVVCGGGGAGHYNTNYVGVAGAAPVLSLVPVSTVLNTAGNAGSYNSGGKGSAAAATCAGGASVYLDYGRGQGCKTSEYAAKRSWINGTNGYVRIRSI